MSEATESDLVETYVKIRAIAIDALNAATRALQIADDLAPAVRKTCLSDYIPLSPGEKASVSLAYKSLRVPNFLVPYLSRLRGVCVSRSCAVGFEIVQPNTDNVLCVLDTSKPLFEVTLEVFLKSFVDLSTPLEPSPLPPQQSKKSKKLF